MPSQTDEAGHLWDVSKRESITLDSSTALFGSCMMSQMCKCPCTVNCFADIWDSHCHEANNLEEALPSFLINWQRKNVLRRFGRVGAAANWDVRRSEPEGTDSFWKASHRTSYSLYQFSRLQQAVWDLSIPPGIPLLSVTLHSQLRFSIMYQKTKVMREGNRREDFEESKSAERMCYSRQFLSVAQRWTERQAH